MTVSSPEDVCNLALHLVGYPRRINDLYEGTTAAKISLDYFSAARDETLRMKDWPFARRSAVLILLKSAGSPPYGGGEWNPTNYPQPPWLYEYQVPSDLIYLRYIRSTPTVIPILDPEPVLFTVANDQTYLSTLQQGSKVILTDEPNAIAVYTGQILDMSQWEPLFVDACAQTLAKKFVVALAQNLELLKDRREETAMSIEMADQRPE